MRALIILSLLLLVLSGCAATVDISDINDDPSRYLGKKVTVQGKVSLPMDMSPMSGFTLKQDKSSMLISSDVVPESGSEVTVSGTLVKGVFTSQHFIYADSVR